MGKLTPGSELTPDAVPGDGAGLVAWSELANWFRYRAPAACGIHGAHP
jgi:hypothetical protein